MSNRVSASIKLGGVLPSALFETFLAIVASEDLSAEWDGPSFTSGQIPADGPLELFAHEVSGGSFDDLEAFCAVYGLAFVRWCDGYPGEWSPERLVFDGAGEARSYRVDDNDQVVLTRGEIRALGTLSAMEAHFAAADIDIPAFTITNEESRHG